ILEMIEKKPGIWNNLITKEFKVDHKTIQYHLNKLIDLGLIRFKKDGRKKKIYPNLESDYFNQE
ncbi:MAG: winged helix-turn-helix transcriptional regulator, partial [Candidatus Lokiarchaeota archaeon]|nr:winged helix-turn-helix transcriptional regulator [Candidatus Lokiarchaeota archaeon]